MKRFSAGTAAAFVAAFTISTLSAQAPAPAAAKAKPPARFELTSTASCAAPISSAIRPTACAGRPTPRSSISTGASRAKKKPRPTWSAATAATPTQADRRQKQEHAARQRPMGQGPQARPLRRPRRHRDARRATGARRRSPGRPAARAARAGRGTTRTSPTCATATCSSSRSTAPGRRHAAHRRRAEEGRSAPDRQPEVHARRGREADRRGRRSRRTEKKKARGRRRSRTSCRRFELQDRQSAVDLMLSPDDTHVFIARRRAAGRREEHDRAQLRHRDRLHRGHSRRAPTSATRRIAALLAVLNLKTGKTVWADGSFAPPVADAEKPAPAADRRPTRGRAEGRARDPLVDARPSPTTASWPSPARARPTTRTAGSSRSIPTPARPR